MHDKIAAILGEHRIAALATVRHDGWPQATNISYVNDRLTIYCMVSRRSQKFVNLERDARASLAIGGDYNDVSDIHGLSMAAMAMEVRDAEPRERVLSLLFERHPRLRVLGTPSFQDAALMRLTPRIVTIVDFSSATGHADVVTVGADGLTEMQPARPADWGFVPCPERQPEVRWRS